MNCLTVTTYLVDAKFATFTPIDSVIDHALDVQYASLISHPPNHGLACIVFGIEFGYMFCVAHGSESKNGFFSLSWVSKTQLTHSSLEWTMEMGTMCGCLLWGCCQQYWWSLHHCWRLSNVVNRLQASLLWVFLKKNKNNYLYQKFDSFRAK